MIKILNLKHKNYIKYADELKKKNLRLVKLLIPFLPLKLCTTEVRRHKNLHLFLSFFLKLICKRLTVRYMMKHT